MKKIKGILTVLCLLTVGIPVAGGGVGSTFTNDSVCTQIDDVASWTYMVYLVGDMTSNTEESRMVSGDDEMLNTINLMELSGSTIDVNILVQADDYEIWGGKQGNISGTRRYYIQHDDNPNELAEYILNENVWYLGEQNMGDPDVLKDFITWATSEYPAEHNILVVQAHGGGWLGIGLDYTSGMNNIGSIIDFPKINIHKAGINIQEWKTVLSSFPKLDILFLYGCQMGQIEVFYELKENADVILASEATASWPPSATEIPLKNLTSNPELTSLELSQLIVDNYKPELYYNATGWSPLYGLQKKYIDNITKAVDTFAGIITDQYLRTPLKIRHMLKLAFSHSTMDLQIKKNNYTDMYAHELYEFAEKICDLSKNTMPIIYNSALEVLSVINNSSIIKPSENSNEKYHGVSIFSPPTARSIGYVKYFINYLTTILVSKNNRYKSLDFAKDTMWDELLNLYYMGTLKKIMG